MPASREATSARRTAPSIRCSSIAGRRARCRASRSRTRSCCGCSRRRAGRRRRATASRGACSTPIATAPTGRRFFGLLAAGNQAWCVNAAVLVVFVSQTHPRGHRPSAADALVRHRLGVDEPGVSGLDQRLRRARHGRLRLRARPHRAGRAGRTSTSTRCARSAAPGRSRTCPNRSARAKPRARGRRWRSSRSRGGS